MQMHANLRDIGDLVADHHNKAHIAIKHIMQVFGFPMHMKVAFILYCSLLRVQCVLSGLVMSYSL